MRGFDVRIDGWKLFYVPALVHPIRTDTVFYADSDPITIEEVKRSLVDHDGYPSDIIVTERK